MSGADALGYIISIYIWLLANPIISLILYFLPIVIACIRKHKSTGIIIIIGLLFGWIFLLWLILVLWSLLGESTPIDSNQYEHNITEDNEIEINKKLNNSKTNKARTMSMFK
jgi:hypothetical protein